MGSAITWKRSLQAMDDVAFSVLTSRTGHRSLGKAVAPAAPPMDHGEAKMRPSDVTDHHHHHHEHRTPCRHRELGWSRLVHCLPPLSS